jgi:hypothetical protein
MWIVNGNVHPKNNIPHSKQFFVLVFYWLDFICSFPIGRDLRFLFRIRIAENTQTSRFTIHIMKVLSQSPMRIHDVTGKFAIYYPHHEDMKTPSSLLSAFMKKLTGLC